ncbi:NAD(P)-binding protein [Hypoxylon trugodes]|uniref:NAD(P)-binding protein n=1 Tax=Hypoxylon trugodes TaxID=326681 RepID=UPI00219A534E|nr:NAD(P)-binding protein [Hypoxylon trugodes]KAI1385090.1 NAD(P)-binding protein [Hypoxylon trugodes]
MSVALITAGSAGLGAATVRLFAKNGFRIIVNYANNDQRANKLIEELPAISTLPQDGGRSNFIAIKADLGNRDDVNRLVRESIDKFGRLDVVFSNGGWTRYRGMDSIDDNAYEEEWDRSFNMNVKSHLWLMQAAKKHLDETEGAFITTASTAGISISASSLAYAVTKAAQIHLAKALASMAAPKIRVNSVSPGLLMTEWIDDFPKESKETHLQKTKLKRFVAVEDVAEQVLTFARNKSMTGLNVVVDAGFTL